MKFLVDRNVIAEAEKEQREQNPACIRWLKANSSELYTSPIVLGEKEKGIELLPLLSLTAGRVGGFVDTLGAGRSFQLLL